MSVESLHHFTAEQKLALYRKLAAALKPDGYFILTDYFAESEAQETAYFDTLQKQKQEQHITDDALYHYDTPLTVEHEIQLLRKAGFSEVLRKHGMEVSDNGDALTIRNTVYPHAMTGLLYLCNASDSKYKWMHFLRLDFKNAYSPLLTVEDICKTLPSKSSEIVKKLEDNLRGLKIKTIIKPLRGIVSDFKWKVAYSYKGKNVCGFYADNAYFMLCIYFNDFRNITAFAALLQQEDKELFTWFQNRFPERLCKCPNNRRVCFGGEFRRICGLSNRAEVVNPTAADMENVLYILQKYQKFRTSGKVS